MYTLYNVCNYSYYTVCTLYYRGGCVTSYLYVCGVYTNTNTQLLLLLHSVHLYQSPVLSAVYLYVVHVNYSNRCHS